MGNGMIIIATATIAAVIAMFEVEYVSSFYYNLTSSL